MRTRGNADFLVNPLIFKIFYILFQNLELYYVKIVFFIVLFFSRFFQILPNCFDPDFHIPHSLAKLSHFSFAKKGCQ